MGVGEPRTRRSFYALLDDVTASNRKPNFYMDVKIGQEIFFDVLTEIKMIYFVDKMSFQNSIF
jgi:hypothetical protein